MTLWTLIVLTKYDGDYKRECPQEAVKHLETKMPPEHDLPPAEAHHVQYGGEG